MRCVKYGSNPRSKDTVLVFQDFDFSTTTTDQYNHTHINK
jgi:hypothetical protein